MKMRCKYNCGAGFTIVELVVVLAIMATLLSIATFAFHDWMLKSGVETQVRQMATDLNAVRLQSMTMKLRQSVTINANSYVFKSYTSYNEPLTSGTLISGGSHTVVNSLQRINGSSVVPCAGEIYEIDQRGQLVGPTATIIINTTTGSATVDCLNIYTVLVNPGKYDATAVKCNDQ